MCGCLRTPGKAATPDPATGQPRSVVERVPFLSLGLDLPPAPLYKDVMEKNIIPQACDRVTDLCITVQFFIRRRLVPPESLVEGRDMLNHGGALSGDVDGDAPLTGSLNTSALTHAAPAQVPIFEILKKYDGVRIHDDIKNGRRRCVGCLVTARDCTSVLSPV